MRIAVGSTLDAGVVRRADTDRLHAVVLRQAFAAMLKPGAGGAKSLAQDSWRSMLAEAMADVTARAVEAGARNDTKGSVAWPAVGALAAREVAR